MQFTYFSLSCGVQYIEVPKCASTSIKLALLESDGLREQLGAYPHACRRWRAVPGYFRPCVVFTFVRHPLERLLSAWREKLQTGKARHLGGACPLLTTASFDEWVQWITSQQPTAVDKHWRPQARILRNQNWPDFIGKIENLTADWQRLMDEYGLPPLPHANESADTQRPEISAVTLGRIANFYAEDLQAFGYTVN